MSNRKPSVLIIGGLGYIGRFLALFIHQNDFASEIRLVDKRLPELAWLAPDFAEACSHDNFIQADASNPDTLNRIFDRSDGEEWDYVFNCGGETKYSQRDEIYEARSLNLSLIVGKECAKRGVKVFVELSTGLVYKPSSSPNKEMDELRPNGRIAAFKRQAEEKLSKIEGLPLAIVRLPHVYGPYSGPLMATVLCLARVYQTLGKEMKWPWTPSCRINTVHVHDVSRALWQIATWYDAGQKGWSGTTMTRSPIFNVVDKGNTDQRRLTTVIERIFGIKTAYESQGVRQAIGGSMGIAVDDFNYEAAKVWMKLLADASISRPVPLTPFVEIEMLCETDLSLDGELLERLLGFKYERPVLTVELLEEVVESYKRMKWWP